MSSRVFGSHQVGLRNVGSYQVSGYPYITGSSDHDAGSEIKYQFPFVAKSISVITSGSATNIRIHYNQASDGRVTDGIHYIEMDGNEEAITMNVKCKEIYVTSVADNSAYQIFAELTQIPTSSMPPLTGSGLTD